MLETLMKDVTFSLRRLRGRPTHTALAVLTLSLGVSGTAAVYSVAEPLLFDRRPA